MHKISFMATTVLIFLFLAGCISNTTGDASPDSKQDDETSQDPPPESSNDESPPATPPEPANPDLITQHPSGPPLVEKSWDIDWNGKLPYMAGQPNGYGPHTGDYTGWWRWNRQDIPGTIVAADLTLSWSATGPGTQELQFNFSPIALRDGGEYYTPQLVRIEGASPLQIDLVDLGWENGNYTVSTWWTGMATVALEQPFHVEGTITYLAEA